MKLLLSGLQTTGLKSLKNRLKNREQTLMLVKILTDIMLNIFLYIKFNV